MTAAERDHAIACLEKSKVALLGAISGLTQAQWCYKPTPEQWSASECVEHIAIVEARLLRRIQAAATLPADPEDVLAATAGKENLVLKAVPRRGRKVQAP